VLSLTGRGRTAPRNLNVHKRHSTLLGGRRQFQPQVRPATIELHDVQPLALHDHEPRTLLRAPTNIVFLGGARPNGARLSCGALVNDSFPNVRAPSASSAG